MPRLNSGIGAINALVASLAGMTTRVGVLESTLGVATIGVADNGSATNLFSNSQVMAAGPFTATRSGRLTKIRIARDGLGGVSSGTQALRLAAWSDAPGNPGTRIALTAETTVASGELMGKPWVDVLTPPDITIGDVFYLGVHSGQTQGVGRFGYQTTGMNGKKYVWAGDTYNDGTAATFGTPAGSANNQALAIEALIEPDLGSTEALDAHLNDTAAAHAASAIAFTPAGGVVATNVQAAIEEISGGGGGGGGILTQVVDSGTLTSSETSTGPTVDTGTSGGVFLVGSSKSSVAGTLHLEESANGSSWVTRWTVATTSVGGLHVAAAPPIVTGERYVRVRYVNSAAAASGFELVQGYSITA